MDDELRRLATERPAFWKTPRLQFQLLYALYRRHIRGFEREAERLFNDYPRGGIHQYAKKYLDKMSRLALPDEVAPKVGAGFMPARYFIGYLGGHRTRP